jgi:hypothetical protein
VVSPGNLSDEDVALLHQGSAAAQARGGEDDEHQAKPTPGLVPPGQHRAEPCRDLAPWDTFLQRQMLNTLNL